MPDSPNAIATQLPELAAILAHDIKNPLAALVTNLQFAKDAIVATDDPEVIAAIADTLVLCATIDRYASNLDLLARATTRTAHLTSLSIRDAAREIVARHGVHATELGVELRDVEGEDTLVLVDRDLIMRTIDNLVANALDHAPSGSVVATSTSVGSDTVTLTITDAGGSIPVALRPAAIEPAEQGALRKRGGTHAGRGLPLLCAAIAARMMGGRIELDGEGATNSTQLFLRRAPGGG